MKKDELRDAVKGIHLSEEAKREMIKNIKEETGKKRRYGKAAKWQKIAAGAAIAVAAGGVIAFPVRALINDFYMGSIVQVHMEDMTEEESEKLLSDIDNPAYHQEADADSYSREYTADEKAKMLDLYQQYKQGVFPEKELQMAYSEEEAGQYELCYLVNGSRLCLPERELTDEEILEIIEFDVKRDYVLQERAEELCADELANIKEKQNAELAASMENGGITEEQALEIARGYFKDIYGITEEGLDVSCRYFYLEDLEDLSYMNNTYLVELRDAPLYEKNYFFHIGITDGHLVETRNVVGDSYFEAEGIRTEEVEGKIPELREKAAAFMKEKLGISFEQEYVFYETYEGGETTTKIVKFVFPNKDGGVYELQYLWNGEFHQYSELSDTDLSEYADKDGKTRYDQFMGQENYWITSTFKQLN